MLFHLSYVYGEKVQGSAGLQFRIVEYNGIENEVFTTSRKDLINGLTEFTINVRDLQNARGRGFPENARLLLEADVIEDATGKEEKSSEDFLIDMSYVNGRKAAYQKIKILCSDGNDERKMAKDEFTTNDRGQLMEPFTTGITHQHLKFKENEQFIRASTNMNAFSRFSGIIMMITSRGEIVDTSFNKPTNEINMRLENSIYKKVSPGARLLAFYVDKDDNRIVADSTKFAVDPVCRGTPLELKTKKSEIYPGDRTELTVTGPNGMWVGFNIMDKALLLLNSDNVLKHDTASVYLKGATGLCYGTSPGKNSPRRRIELEPNSAHTVSFSVIPLVAGEIPVTVSAFVSSNISGKADVIEKKLHIRCTKTNHFEFTNLI
ncbi:hypothetical protein MAR_037609 [Mya arenaria]|uniref:Alpha-2-macroglobulin bait region domain-containing protein n=1 Tax=Mya arenaria TaxID=6604 RepID=A0ABY7FPE7_MYAAR|nr:hypothetical protein MAR_037609 [Mya arenaria]